MLVFTNAVLKNMQNKISIVMEKVVSLFHQEDECHHSVLDGKDP